MLWPLGSQIFHGGSIALQVGIPTGILVPEAATGQNLACLAFMRRTAVLVAICSKPQGNPFKFRTYFGALPATDPKATHFGVTVANEVGDNIRILVASFLTASGMASL